MGLTESQKKLIQQIANNNITEIRKSALQCLQEDTTQKNALFCERYKKILQSSQGMNMLELPMDLRSFVHLEDASGFQEGRYFLTEAENKVCQSILKMSQVSQRLSEMQIPYVNSTLLYGESGTGKTMFGKYVAYRMGLPFCYLNFSHLISSYMGETSKNISKVFSYVISNPCVFMLDEIDCISIRRGESDSSSGSKEMSRITISLMQEMDRIPNNIIVLAATNRKDRMDEALLRRFTIHHEVKSLPKEDREALVKKYLADVQFSFSDDEIQKLINKCSNPSVLINEIVQMIAEKIAEKECKKNEY